MTQDRQKLIVIGNGMAGMRTVEELLKVAPELYDITVFGAEPHGNYNRILLSPVLAGEKSVEEIMINTAEWYRDNDIHLYAGDPVVEIDRRQKVVKSASGLVLGYDRLLLATGSNPFVIPVPGVDLEGVVTFRDMHDVETMLRYSATHRNAVVIGGGLLGLEAANGLLAQGMDVTVVHLLDTLMERQLDKPASDLLRASLQERGLKFVMPAQTEEIVGADGHVIGLKFADGSMIDTDLVVMSVGIRPNIELGQAAGLQCERGILVDDTLQTYDPSIYAVGECVQHRQATYGLVAPLWEQAKVCASHLAREGREHYSGSVTAAKLKVSGVDLYSVGDFQGCEQSETLEFRDLRSGVYKKLVIRDNKVAGAVLYGDVSDGSWYFDLLIGGADVSEIRDTLIFGKAFCEPEPAAA